MKLDWCCMRPGNIHSNCLMFNSWKYKVLKARCYVYSHRALRSVAQSLGKKKENLDNIQVSLAAYMSLEILNVNDTAVKDTTVKTKTHIHGFHKTTLGI